MSFIFPRPPDFTMLGVILDTPEYFLLGILSISILFYCLIVLMSTRVTQVSRKFYFYNPSLFVSASILITSVCLLVVYVIADTGGL